VIYIKVSNDKLKVTQHTGTKQTNNKNTIKHLPVKLFTGQPPISKYKVFKIFNQDYLIFIQRSTTYVRIVLTEKFILRLIQHAVMKNFSNFWNFGPILILNVRLR